MLYNCSGLVAPRLSFVQFLISFYSVCFCVLSVFLQLFRTPWPGKKAVVPIYKVLVDTAESRRFDLPAPNQTHLPLDHGLVSPN